MKCDCYHAEKNWIGRIGVCWGTKEMEPCSCGGDKNKCDFYPEVRDSITDKNYSLSKMRIKSVESIVIYDADGGELLRLVPSLDPINVELTLDEEVKN